MLLSTRTNDWPILNTQKWTGRQTLRGETPGRTPEGRKGPLAAACQSSSQQGSTNCHQEKASIGHEVNM